MRAHPTLKVQGSTQLEKALRELGCEVNWDGHTSPCGASRRHELENRWRTRNNQDGRPHSKACSSRGIRSPVTLDFIERCSKTSSRFTVIGVMRDDPAIVCGFARFHGMPVVVDRPSERARHEAATVRNFGMPKPEGYRKALRVMKLAEKFDRPIFCFHRYARRLSGHRCRRARPGGGHRLQPA